MNLDLKGTQLYSSKLITGAFFLFVHVKSKFHSRSMVRFSDENQYTKLGLLNFKGKMYSIIFTVVYLSEIIVSSTKNRLLSVLDKRLIYSDIRILNIT